MPSGAALLLPDCRPARPRSDADRATLWPLRHLPVRTAPRGRVRLAPLGGEFINSRAPDGFCLQYSVAFGHKGPYRLLGFAGFKWFVATQEPSSRRPHLLPTEQSCRHAGAPNIFWIAALVSIVCQKTFAHSPTILVAHSAGRCRCTRLLENYSHILASATER